MCTIEQGSRFSLCLSICFDDETNENGSKQVKPLRANWMRVRFTRTKWSTRDRDRDRVQWTKWNEAIATMYWQMLDDVSHVFIFHDWEPEWWCCFCCCHTMCRILVDCLFCFQLSTYIFSFVQVFFSCVVPAFPSAKLLLSFFMFVPFLFQSFFFSWIKRTVNEWLL